MSPPTGPPASGPRAKLPWVPFVSICAMYLTNSLSQTILFPFAAIMVASFGVTDDPAKLGYYAGYLASAYFVGNLLTSTLWGALSDKIGRKPVLLVGISANLVCAILFGLSPSYEYAMTVRFVNGLFSTVLATGRSFALMSTMFGTGLLIGPALGGFLSEPADKYPALFPPGSLFATFPFFLPCLALAVITLGGLLVTIFCLPETLGTVSAAPVIVSQPAESSAGSETVAANGEAGQKSEGIASDLRQPLLPSLEAPTAAVAPPKSFAAIMLNRDTVIASALLGVLSFTTYAFTEVFPLWCITPWELGGLAFGTNGIAAAQVTSGLALIPLQMFVYPPLVNRVGPVSALRIATSIGVLLIFFPLVRLFGKDTLGLQLATSAFMALRSCPQCIFTSVSILLSNSVDDPRYLGTVNGAAQTASMVFSALAPSLSASFYSWTASLQGPILNTNFWFYVIAAMYVSMVAVAGLFTNQAETRRWGPGAPK